MIRAGAEYDLPTLFHTNVKGAMISCALFITNSWLAASDDKTSSIPGLSSMYNLVIFRSLGMQRMVPFSSE